MHTTDYCAGVGLSSIEEKLRPGTEGQQPEARLPLPGRWQLTDSEPRACSGDQKVVG